MEQLRACRLVVDTGMHAFGWSRDRALRYMLDNTAMAEHDAGNEVTRYITWPGQACAYKVGERKIRELRTKCETEVGNFDVRDFYSIVLNAGAVPLTKLEDMINTFIARSNGGGGGGGRDDETKVGEETSISDGSADFLSTMSFANWCKCCKSNG